MKYAKSMMSGIVLFAVHTTLCVSDGLQLHYAALFGNAQRVQMLLNEGADVNAKDAGGKRPLHEAANWGTIELVQALLDVGAKVDRRALDNARSNEMYRLLLALL